MSVRFLFCVPLVFFGLFVSVSAQNLGFERDRHQTMLRLIKNDVEKHYFDPTFQGISLDAAYRTANEKLAQATSIGQMNAIIAQFLMAFDDSHLYFIPPGKANKTDYGFDLRMLGDRCFIYSIDQKSDAAKQGLQVGDEIVELEGYSPTRETLWKMRYYYYRLRPRPLLKMIVQKPDGKEVNYEIQARITTGKQVMDLTGTDLNDFMRQAEDAYIKTTKQYFYDKTEGVFVWKMPSFSLEPAKVDDITDRAKKSPALILDLRGNGGGRVDMVLRLIGNFFPENLKVGDEKKRKDSKELMAKSRGKSSYTGKVVVLIDNGSASASEVFARVMQLENRGTVLGDRSAGMVMESKVFGYQTGVGIVAFFGTSITVADLLMKDGKSLEKVGVTPDEVIVPTGRDLAAGRDIVLSRAFELLGLKVSPEEAGKIFPIEYND